MIKDILECNDIAQNSPKGAAALAQFASLTIRTQFETVPRQVADILNNGLNSKYIWGFKNQCFDWLNVNATNLQANALEAMHNPVDLVDVFMDVPGLGLAKAGFCAQLFANQVGCLDYLNLKLYGMTEIVCPKGLTSKTRRIKIAQYVEQCAACGTSPELWANWCNEIGKRKSWPNGNAVSRVHVNLIRPLAA